MLEPGINRYSNIGGNALNHAFILFLCLACIFCVPFVYLSNVCSFSLLFSYLIVLARLSQVFIPY